MLFEEAIRGALDRLQGPERLREACAYACLNGGKRIRPQLVYQVAKCLGDRDPTPAAISVEFFHCSSLIADDLPCMDDDEERRGKPSCHIVYGETTALLASFALISAGYEQLGVSQVSDEIVRLALMAASKETGCSGLIGGQQLDLSPPDQTVETMKHVIDFKTAALFRLSLVYGWLYGGGAPDQIDEVNQLGTHLGTLFQLIDDLHDLHQDKKNGAPLNSGLLLGVSQTLEMIECEAAIVSDRCAHLGLDLQSSVGSLMATTTFSSISL